MVSYWLLTMFIAIFMSDSPFIFFFTTLIVLVTCSNKKFSQQFLVKHYTILSCCKLSFFKCGMLMINLNCILQTIYNFSQTSATHTMHAGFVTCKSKRIQYSFVVYIDSHCTPRFPQGHYKNFEKWNNLFCFKLLCYFVIYCNAKCS